MFSKSIIWPTLVAFLFFFFVPYGFYGVTEECFNEHVLINIARGANIMLGALAVGVLIMSYAFVHIFQKWSGGIFSNTNGFIFGLWVSLLEVVAIGIIRFATTNANEAEFYVLDGIYWIGMYTVGGVLVALISRKTS